MEDECEVHSRVGTAVRSEGPAEFNSPVFRSAMPEHLVDAEDHRDGGDQHSDPNWGVPPAWRADENDGESEQ